MEPFYTHQVVEALLVTEGVLRKWIGLFNESGIDGLILKKRPGRTAILGGQQAKELVELLEQPEKAEQTIWTAKAFHGHIGDSYQIQCSYETVVRFSHKSRFTLKTPPPWPDRQDEAQREAFRKQIAELLENPDVDVWFADESGFEGDPGPRRRWDRRGNKTRITKNGDHLRMDVVGMVCPRSGEFFAIEASYSDSETIQAFLDEAERFVPLQHRRNVPVPDNAARHRKRSIKWNGWEPLFLPPYSPDLNPIERIWLTMKAKWFNNYVSKTVEKLLERLDHAILDVINHPDRVKRTAAIGTLF